VAFLASRAECEESRTNKRECRRRTKNSQSADPMRTSRCTHHERQERHREEVHGQAEGQLGLDEVDEPIINLSVRGAEMDPDSGEQESHTCVHPQSHSGLHQFTARTSTFYSPVSKQVSCVVHCSTLRKDQCGPPQCSRPNAMLRDGSRLNIPCVMTEQACRGFALILAGDKR